MTNKDKERLRELAYLFFGWLNNNIKPNQQLLIDKQAILSLIDSVPSEEEAKDLCQKIEEGFIHHGSQPMTNNGWEALRKIRKALNLGEEG